MSKFRNPVKNVTLIRLSDFVKNVVGRRKIPVISAEIGPPRVVMKMDIERSEVDVIPDLIFSGGLAHINRIMVEWHKRLETLSERRQAQTLLEAITKLLSKYSQSMIGKGGKFDFKLLKLDDESYSESSLELPKC